MPASPSLLIVPARFKTGKLYTQIATTSAGVVLGSSGDFNVTRATTATRFNSAGLIESVASGVPRLDYFTSGGTAGCPALLVEPSGSNLVLQSAFATGWGTAGSGTITPNSATSPENQNTAAQLNVVTTTFSSTSRTLTTVSGTVYTVSVFAKKNTKDWIYFVNLTGSAARVWFNVASGTIGTIGAGISNVAIENYGNGWYRCRWTETAGGTTSYFQVGASDADNSALPTSSGSVFLWGAQLEVGSVATSYIPTTTAAVTRNADVISLSGAVSGCIGQTEGTIYAEVDMTSQSGVTRTLLTLSDGTTTNRIRFRLTTATNLEMERTVSGSVNASLNVTVPASGVSKIALGYNASASGFVIYVNGSSVGTIAAATPTFTNQLIRIDIGSNIGSSPQFNDRIRSAAIYTSRLTNAELAALTTL